MTWSFVGKNSNVVGVGSGGSPLPLTVPAGTTDGDFCWIAVVVHGTGETVTPPTNFIQLDTGAGQQSASHTGYHWWKKASGEPATWNVTLSPATWATGICLVLRSSLGVDTVKNHAIRKDASAYTTTLPPPSLTINGSGDATVYAYTGEDLAGSGTETGSGTTLSDIVQNGNTNAGQLVYAGWGVNVSAPGNCTNSPDGLDYITMAADVAELAGAHLLMTLGVGK